MGKICISFVVLVTFLSACGSKNNSTKADFNNACCCTAIQSVNGETVFIPSVFTPNGDFSNDAFQIIGGPGIDKITNINIKDMDGNILLNIDKMWGSSSNKSWDGNINGVPYEGNFQVSAIVTLKSGVTEQVNGKSCVYNCALHAAGTISNASNCMPGDRFDLVTGGLFPTQDPCFQ
jgi:gliding motility-associated-like protein